MLFFAYTAIAALSLAACVCIGVVGMTVFPAKTPRSAAAIAKRLAVLEGAVFGYASSVALVPLVLVWVAERQVVPTNTTGLVGVSVIFAVLGVYLAQGAMRRANTLRATTKPI